VTLEPDLTVVVVMGLLVLVELPEAVATEIDSKLKLNTNKIFDKVKVVTMTYYYIGQ
jgi:hypothetical protein